MRQWTARVNFLLILSFLASGRNVTRVFLFVVCASRIQMRFLLSVCRLRSCRSDKSEKKEFWGRKKLVEVQIERMFRDKEGHVVSSLLHKFSWAKHDFRGRAVIPVRYSANSNQTRVGRVV